MIQPQIQTKQYWISDLTITDNDIENLYNYLIETENPQNITKLAQTIIHNRIREEKQRIEQQLSGRTIYKPNKTYTVDEEIIFPSLKLASGTVMGMRQGYNPEFGEFSVIQVNINNKTREFAAKLEHDHALNEVEHQNLLTVVDPEEIYQLYGEAIENKLTSVLEKHSEFICLAREWFVKALLVDINIGHLHLAEAVLEMSGGGPLPVDEILVHLELDKAISPAVQRFSINYALLQDERFDEVAPKEKVAWFLHRLEPEAVRKPIRYLDYTTPISYDLALLSSHLRTLERELDDEWSDIASVMPRDTVILTLTYPHRRAGTLPLSPNTRHLFQIGHSPRQIFKFVDANSGEAINAWVVAEYRYIYGFAEWFKTNEIPVGGFIHLKAGETPDTIILDYDRRRAKKEWIRLAEEENHHIKFALQRRSVACHYDDLMSVGTDYVAAIDALWQTNQDKQRSVASVIAEVLPALASMEHQNAAHSKTIYSAVNMLKRVPPGPLFAELVRHPAFNSVGEHYWQFDATRWRK